VQCRALHTSLGSRPIDSRALVCKSASSSLHTCVLHRCASARRNSPALLSLAANATQVRGYACVHVCVRACEHVCVSVSVSVCVYVCVCVCVCENMSTCMNVNMCECVHACNCYGCTAVQCVKVCCWFTFYFSALQGRKSRVTYMICSTALWRANGVCKPSFSQHPLLAKQRFKYRRAHLRNVITAPVYTKAHTHTLV